MSTKTRNRLLWGVVIGLSVLNLLLISGQMVSWFLSTPAGTPPTSSDPDGDLRVYQTAAQAALQRADLYLLTSWNSSNQPFLYHPVLALAFIPTLGWDPALFGVLWLLLQMGAYMLSLLAWQRVLRDMLPDIAGWRRWLWVGVLSSPLYTELIAGNLNSVLLLLSGLATYWLYHGQKGKAAAALTILVLIKPYWAFPLILLVVRREWKRLFQVALLIAMGCVSITLLYLALVGLDYGLRQVQDYFVVLSRIDVNYPWEGQNATFVEMDHSFQQTLLHYLGTQVWIPAATWIWRICLVGLLVVCAWYAMRRADPARQVGTLWLAHLVSLALLRQLWAFPSIVVAFVVVQTVVDVRWLARCTYPCLLFALSEFGILLAMITGNDGFILARYLPQTLLALLLLILSLAFFILRPIPVHPPDKVGVT